LQELGEESKDAGSRNKHKRGKRKNQTKTGEDLNNDSAGGTAAGADISEVGGAAAAGVSAGRTESWVHLGANRTWAGAAGGAGAGAGAATSAAAEREAENELHTQEMFKTESAGTEYEEVAKSKRETIQKQREEMGEADSQAAGEAEAEEELCTMLADLLVPAAASLTRTSHARVDDAQVTQQSAATNQQLNAAPLSTVAVVVEEKECCVCMEATKSNSFIPCGHRCVCQTCADTIMLTTKECPVCRVVSIGAFKIYV